MKKFIILGIILIVVGFFLTWLFLGFYKKSGQSITLNVKYGDSTQQIAQKLKQEKAIFSPLIFAIYIHQRHWAIQTGVFQIESGMNMMQIASILHEGKVVEHLITVPEGWRVTQIDEMLTEKNLIKAGEFTKIASADEGYLFPDTYRLSLDATPSQIRDLMRDNFDKKIASLNVSSQIVIIASIVEREAKFDEDRPKIAGVYLSRLAQGIKLEADPTIQYAKGSWAPITLANYHNVESPYNTYLHSGLPPGPICNPGLKSIEAVIHPQSDGSLFFFHKSDGYAVYSKTLEEHQANLKKYR